MRAHRPRPSFFLAALCVACAACSKPAKESAGSATAAATAAAPATTPTPKACALVTAAELSAIVGVELTVDSEASGGSTACTYRPRGGGFGYVEVKVDWGGGRAAMAAMGILGRVEPGIAESLKGVGDQASAVGPALMIRTGEDLITLTVYGVDRSPEFVRRVVQIMRPRMGSSSQPDSAGNAGNGGQPAQSDDARQAATAASELIGGLLGAVSEQQKREMGRAEARGGSNGGAHASSSAATDPRAREEEFSRATGPAPRIPLVKGLTIATARHEPGRGDYEPLVIVTEVTDAAVTINFSANLPDGEGISIARVIRREDLRTARRLRSWFYHDDPGTFPGTTAFGLSIAAMRELRETGQTEVARFMPRRNALLDGVMSALGGAAPDTEQRGTLRRVEPYAVGIPILLNDAPAVVPAIHARGIFGDETVDYYVLDDPENPLSLRFASRDTARVVRIAFPVESEAPLEKRLADDERVELHGIYFDFGRATLRSESEPVLRQIAAAMSQHPDWKLGIEGHTDDIGGGDANLNLSRTRASAVKSALVERFGVSAHRLTTEGYGASRPKESNASISGRARNRRVELVRQ
jgi:outer membrane protein OmpA-like peptidoglycan-associated protein